MSESVNPESSFPPTAEASSRTWVVGDVSYANSAAKFWSSFLDDVQTRHPCADCLTLSAPSEGPLHPGLLMPEQTLAESLERIDLHTDFDVVMRSIAAELEAVGLPPAVTLAVMAGDKLLEDQELTDFLDAEIFPFLLVWLLEWSCLKEAAWNRSRLRGDFSAEDSGRGVCYRIKFLLKNRHLSEGLFRRSLVMQWERTRRDRGERDER